MDYPWFELASDPEIVQGEIFLGVPLVIQPASVAFDGSGDLVSADVEAEVTTDSVVVLSQSCDLVSGRKKIDYVLTCRVRGVDRYSFESKACEEIRRGNRPRYHMIDRCELEGFQCGYRILDFGTCYSIPISLMRHLAGKSRRVRLLHPYREHMAQAFARFFMRVGLPKDIDQFV